LLYWTVAAFARHEAIDGIIVVTGQEDVAHCRSSLAGLEKVLAIVAGAGSRQASVQVGLFALGAAPDDVILVHDGARPLVTAEVISRCIAGVQQAGSAVAALPVTDTLKRVGDQTPQAVVVETVERDGLWAVQTPQTFRYQTLLNASVAASDVGFLGTDEASLVEQLGDVPVHLVLGEADNLKVTRPEDLALAEAILGCRQGIRESMMRVGFGYDIHRLIIGRRLVLGGVEITDSQGRGLDGHSDADVLLHALCDALLGAAGLPDIGVLYPNTEAAYAGIDSMELLADVAQRLRRQHLSVVNVDASLIAESPKISPYVGQMRANIAGALGLEPAQVGIKATTNEGLGSLGRGEGIAAHAVVSLSSS
jgi:2-C-methyl-D-erythritol 4-phosphate cytidylyltransferase/2-C-methyl-D-erythritol 2,4-cyclodiphosphate synthase